MRRKAVQSIENFMGNNLLRHMNTPFPVKNGRKIDLKFAVKKFHAGRPCESGARQSQSGKSTGRLTEGRRQGARLRLSEPGRADGGPYSRFFQSPVESVKMQQIQ